MIAVYNDGKEKWQSFEAVFTDKDSYGSPLFGESGYGADEEEAVADLLEKLAAAQAVLAGISKDVVERKGGRPQ